MPRPPREYVRSDGYWPIGPFTSDAPVQVHELARLAATLESSLEWRTIVDVAAAANISRFTVSKLLSGEVWPEFFTISRLQEIMDVDLWPGRIQATA